MSSPPDGIGPVCDLLPRLPEAAQIQVIAAISRYPAARVRPAVLAAADERFAGGARGRPAGAGIRRDASTVLFLAETAASAEKGPVQDAARRALAGVPGRAVDDAIVSSLKQPASDASRSNC